MTVTPAEFTAVLSAISQGVNPGGDAALGFAGLLLHIGFQFSFADSLQFQGAKAVGLLPDAGQQRIASMNPFKLINQERRNQDRAGRYSSDYGNGGPLPKYQMFIQIVSDTGI
ncbi:MAG: hypothetical protein ACYDET_08295 [Thermoleophilia bacterium]